MKEIEVFAVRMHEEKLLSVKTNSLEIISEGKLRSMIEIEGHKFFINLKGKSIYFKLSSDGEEFDQPSPETLSEFTQF